MAERFPIRLLDEASAATRLSVAGIQPTRQRLRIAQILFAEHQHLSADQVLERVNHIGKPVSKATVYNTLGLFAKRGILREVIVDPNRIFYDTNSTPHHHVYNIATGELSDIELDGELQGRIPDLPAGTELESVEVVIRVRPAESRA